MDQVLIRSVYLLRRPAVLLAVLLLTAGGVALARLPMVGLPGYELAGAVTVGIGILGGVVGGAAAFLERRLIQGRDPRPGGALRSDSALTSVGRAFAAALLLNLVLLLPPLAVSIGFTLTTVRCDLLAFIGFYPLLTIPSAVLATAAGVLCAFWARNGFTAALGYLGLILLSLLITAIPLVWGPQAFAFNHFLGYLPGPSLEDAVAVRPGLMWFRVQTLLIALALWFFTALLLDMREGRLGLVPRLRPGALLLLLVSGAGAVLLEQAAPALGFRMSDGYLEEHLGGRRDSEHFLILYPLGKPREEVERLVRDLEFRREQLAVMLGETVQERIRVVLHRSPGEKLALVGTAQPELVKPWRREVHLDDAGFPHPRIKHALAHVMLAPLGSGPFQVTSRNGLVPMFAASEGMAVALEDPADALTLHQWAAAMRRQKLAPDIRSLLAPRASLPLLAPPERASIMVGSFFRYLLEVNGLQGIQKLSALYARADFPRVYERPLEALAEEWEKFLDGLELPPEAPHLAAARFRREGPLARACLREVVALQAEAAELLSRDPARALARYQRCAALQPEEPSFSLAQVDALMRLDQPADAANLLTSLQSRLGEQPLWAAEVALAQAELALQRQRPDDARAHVERALQSGAGERVDREARVLQASLDNTVGAVLRAQLRPTSNEVRVLDLRDALASYPRDPYLAYVFGRRLLRASAPARAHGLFGIALAASDLPPSLRAELLGLRIESSYLAGDCASVRNEVSRLSEPGPVLAARAREWVQRCDFEEKTFERALAAGD